jgi:transcriptional regulator with XRE-family HTH domain
MSELRTARGLSQADLAALSGIHINTIKNLERSSGLPKPSTVVKLLKAMQKQASFSVDEIAQIRETWGIEPHAINVPTARPPDHTGVLALVEALRVLVGNERALFLLKTLLIAETNRMNVPPGAVRVQRPPVEGVDGKQYQVTEYIPTAAKPPAAKSQPRKSV